MEVSDDLMADLVSGPQSLLLLVFEWQGYCLLLVLPMMDGPGGPDRGVSKSPIGRNLKRVSKIPSN
jgi:hypothetical protein